MADEQYKWLDRDAAERLLRGEPLEAVDADTRAAAHRLTEALDALTALTVPTSENLSADAELPGEEAALAAFRKRRAERDAEAAAVPGRARTHSTAHSADAGLVRLGRPGPGERRARWGRPLRLGMAAALAAGMLGGVAVAAGTGILPTPLRDDRPQPGSSVTAPVTPDRPHTTPSPEGTAGGYDGAPSTGGAGDGSKGDGAPDDTARGGGTPGQPGSQEFGQDRRGAGGNWRSGLLAACRDIRAGKDLTLDRRRGLEDAAGGKGRVRKYCAVVLGGQDDRTTPGTSHDGRGDGRARSGRGEDGHGSGKGQGGGHGSGKGQGGGHGKGQGGGEGKGGRGDKGGRGGGGEGEGPGIPPGGNDHHGGGPHGSGLLITPFSTFHVSTPSGAKPGVSPCPTYSALGSPRTG